MSVSRSRDDSAALAGIEGGYAPLTSGLLVPAAYLGANSADRRLLQITSGIPGWGLPHAWGCIVSGSSTALTSGQYNSLAFGSADTYDPDGYHDPSSNNTRITIPSGLGGIYMIGLLTTWPNTTNADTEERTTWRVNGGADQNLFTRERATANMVTGTVSFSNGNIPISLAAGDYVEFRQWVTNATSPQTTTSYVAWAFLIGVT